MREYLDVMYEHEDEIINEMLRAREDAIVNPDTRYAVYIFPDGAVCTYRDVAGGNVHYPDGLCVLNECWSYVAVPEDWEGTEAAYREWVVANGEYGDVRLDYRHARENLKYVIRLNEKMFD